MSDSIAVRGPVGMRTLLVVLAAAVAMLFAIAGPASKASAAPFCDGVTLAKYGSPGDRCLQGLSDSGRLATIQLNTFNRAGCVDRTDYYGNLETSWTCIGANSSTLIYVPNDLNWHRGIIRNNNTVNSGFFGASYQCWGTCQG